jgi:YegS/Rv2252/BmrU family lipid kinase
VILVLVLTATLTKWIGAWATQLVLRMKAAERRMLFGLSNAHAAGALAMIMVGTQLQVEPGVPLIGDDIINAVVLLILVSCIISSLITERAARQIAQGTEHRVDCGKVNDRYFVNVLSFGVLTTTSQQTSDAEKHIFGKLAYLRVGTRDLMTMHRIPIVAKFDNEEVHTDAAMMLIFNGRSAGRFKLAPDASINDGMLDILILDYENMAKICASMMHYLIGGKDSKVRYIRTNHIELHCDIDERTDVDGQPGPQFPLSVECLKDELKIRI